MASVFLTYVVHVGGGAHSRCGGNRRQVQRPCSSSCPAPEQNKGHSQEDSLLPVPVPGPWREHPGLGAGQRWWPSGGPPRAAPPSDSAPGLTSLGKTMVACGYQQNLLAGVSPRVPWGPGRRPLSLSFLICTIRGTTQAGGPHRKEPHSGLDKGSLMGYPAGTAGTESITVHSAMMHGTRPCSLSAPDN